MTRPHPLTLTEDGFGLATDLYQLTMMAAYWEAGRNQEVSFELFVRRLPKQRSYLVVAGLQQALAYLDRLCFGPDEIAWLRAQPVFARTPAGFWDWLADYRFSGEIHALPEGSIAFAGEPLLTVTAPLAEAQLIETYLLSVLNYQTLVASKAARVVQAAQGRSVVDFGFRRGHGPQASLYAARAGWIAGLAGTSNVLAGRELGIPVMGTAAHAYIMSFASEQEAFAHYHRCYPEHCTLLVDTYDTLEGCRRAAEIGPDLRGVRLDSGDLHALSLGCRAILDERGLTETRIIASGDLNEYRIADLIARGAAIDAFGVGTELITSRDAPSLGGVYKLVERAEPDGTPVPVMKHAEGKLTLPGRKQLYRHYDADGGFAGDTLELRDAPAPAGGSPLLAPVWRDGAPTEATHDATDLAGARARCAEGLARLPASLHDLKDGATVQARRGPALDALTRALMDQNG